MITASSYSDMPHILKLPELTAAQIAAGETEIKRYAFEVSLWLHELIIPEGYTRINMGAFRNARSLRKCTLPTTLKHIGERAFEMCGKLNDINTESVETIGTQAFKDCTQLKDINTLGLQYIGVQAFVNCSSLFGRTAPDENATTKYFRDIQTIGKQAFHRAFSKDDEGDPMAVNLDFGRLLQSIGREAFAHSNIVNVDLGSCSRLTTIGIQCFRDSTLVKIKFPLANKLKVLRDRLFYRCFELTEIYLPSNLRKISAYTFAMSSINVVGRQDIFGSQSADLQVMNTMVICKGAFANCTEFRTPTTMNSQWHATAFNGCKSALIPLFDNPNVFVEMNLNDAECSICYDKFSVQPTCQLGCGHLFHQHCAHKWYSGLLLENQTCPLCRGVITSVAIVLPQEKRQAVEHTDEPVAKRQRTLPQNEALITSHFAAQ